MTRQVALTLFVCVTSLAFSGCVGTEDPPAPTEEVRPLPSAWLFDATQKPLPLGSLDDDLPAFDLRSVAGLHSSEPTLGVTRTGTVFVTARGESVFSTPVRPVPKTLFMRSGDMGASWQDVSPRAAGVETHPDTSDPYVYVDPTTGRVFAVDMTPRLFCNRVSWSDDDGSTWRTQPVACIPGVNDHPTLFAGPATALTNTAVYPNQVYLCVNRISDSLCYQSPDGGLTWFHALPAFLGYDTTRGTEGDCYGQIGHGHASFADGTIYLGRDWCGEASVAVSHDGGVTFSKATIARTGEASPAEHDLSVATDTAGNAYAIWGGNGAYPRSADPLLPPGGPEAPRSLYFSMSRDQGRTWSPPINITAPTVTGLRYPTLVAGAEGSVAFLYVGTEHPTGWYAETCRWEGLFVLDARVCETRDEAALDEMTWNAYLGTIWRADTDDPLFVTVRANGLDTPLKRGGCDYRCRGDDGSMTDFLDIEIDPMTGQVFAALVDVCSGDCDGPGKKTSEVHQRSVGVVAVQTAGPYLLDEPIADRRASVVDELPRVTA